jgi:hypothetical protein
VRIHSEQVVGAACAGAAVRDKAAATVDAIVGSHGHDERTLRPETEQKTRD